jgi:hypothetical protein
VECKGENINSCRVLVGNPEKTKYLEYLIKDGKTIIKLVVNKIL